jgi:indole-3-glycerol phosphate synthase
MSTAPRGAFAAAACYARLVSSLRAALLAEKEAEIRDLAHQSVSEVAPSRCDFTMFVATQKAHLALVPRLQRADPQTGGAWPGCDLVELARACDEADAAAVAVATAAAWGASVDDLRAVAAAVTAPVLRDDLCLHPSQLYQSRLCGADAVILPAAHLDAGDLRALMTTAASMHMASVIEVSTAGELDPALALAPACIGLRCTRADGWADLDATSALAARIPAARTVLLLGEVASLVDLTPLRGRIDAAVVGDALLAAPDPAAAIRTFLAA